MVEQARQNQSNPIDLFKQVTSKRSPEQMDAFYKQIEQMGFSSDLINQLKGQYQLIKFDIDLKKGGR